MFSPNSVHFLIRNRLSPTSITLDALFPSLASLSLLLLFYSLLPNVALQTISLSTEYPDPLSISQANILSMSGKSRK